jgi:hypothetical protein
MPEDKKEPNPCPSQEGRAVTFLFIVGERIEAFASLFTVFLRPPASIKSKTLLHF